MISGDLSTHVRLRRARVREQCAVHMCALARVCVREQRVVHVCTRARARARVSVCEGSNISSETSPAHPAGA